MLFVYLSSCFTNLDLLLLLVLRHRFTQWHRPTLSNQTQPQSTTNSNSSLANRPQNENAEPELNNRSNQRRSTRHRNYLARNTLHQAVANLTNENINNGNNSTVHQPAQPNHSRNSLSIDSTSSTANVNASLTNVNSNPTTQVVHQRSISNLSNSNLNQQHANSIHVPYVENLPEGYEMRIAPKGQVYFYHVPTDTSTWYVYFKRMFFLFV